ncbi:MAG TPA: YjhX family toxin [Caulobacteraceae bacterium]|nr:YjhX family toxin [Caulobacteraceae bacterium]
MNISKPQQRTLHALAQGGAITLVRGERGDILAAECWTRDGWLLSDCNLAVFKALKRRGLIASRGGQPYRITREGLHRLRSQLDNRVSARAW